MSNALRSGLPGQGHLKRGGSATCLKISSMLSRPAVPTVTLRIVRPAVRTSFPATSITSRRSLFAYVCTGGERNSRFRGLSVFAGLEPVLLERLVEIESPGHRPSRKPCWERSPGTASAWPVGPSAPDGQLVPPSAMVQPDQRRSFEQRLLPGFFQSPVDQPAQTEIGVDNRVCAGKVGNAFSLLTAGLRVGSKCESGRKWSVRSAVFCNWSARAAPQTCIAFSGSRVGSTTGKLKPHHRLHLSPEPVEDISLPHGGYSTRCDYLVT